MLLRWLTRSKIIVSQEPTINTKEELLTYPNPNPNPNPNRVLKGVTKVPKGAFFLTKNRKIDK